MVEYNDGESGKRFAGSFLESSEQWGSNEGSGDDSSGEPDDDEGAMDDDE